MFRSSTNFQCRILQTTIRWQSKVSLETVLTSQVSKSSSESSSNLQIREINDQVRLPGSEHDYTLELKFQTPEDTPIIPAYRVLSNTGQLLDGAEHPEIEPSKIVKMYKDMVKLNLMDTVLNDSVTHGILPFYLTSFGEEASQIGSAAALDASDLVYAQYRETGVLMWRGYTLDQFMNQCFNNDLDPTKGRQMPVHYGCKKLNFMSISSCLGTQMPQAAGYAYAFKLSKRQNCVICYFGEGTASEGDAHAAFNFASVLKCPVIYFCKNNGIAISTPATEQYGGDGVACRGVSYGMPSIRVDGNDIFAVYNAVKAARKINLTESRPVLIEAMTYRVGDHTTLVDSSGYRTKDEVDSWVKLNNPITRLRNYLISSGLWTPQHETQLHEVFTEKMTRALKAVQSRKYLSPEQMFTDVYDVLPKHLEKQQKNMMEHLKKYPNEYPLEKHHII